ncbi:MAG: hypothetical protein LBK82_10390 [Planctomycetaceae bacterium]|jgi:hypothetical protein|nr:hypothetical protein [Planctomycetaceae bacterium]
MKPKRRHLSPEEFNRANDKFMMSVVNQMSDELSVQRRKQTEQKKQTQNKDVKKTFEVR